MTSATETPVLPLADRISFRSEEPADEAFLYRLYASTRANEMALTGWNDSQQDAFLRMQFQFQTTHYRKHYADASFQIVVRDDAPIGRLYVYQGASEIRLMDIALLPEYRGSGIGGAIIEDLLREAAQLKKTVTLHVERFNPALRLYHRLGFRVAEDQGVNLFMEWQPEARG
jgi:ribosomal protein S18 acetylase RimI-like enzyme